MTVQNATSFPLWPPTFRSVHWGYFIRVAKRRIKKSYGHHAKTHCPDKTLKAATLQQCHLHSSGAPIQSMVVSLSCAIHPCAAQGLLLVQAGEDTKDHWHARVQSNAHNTLRDSLANVLKVHGRSFNQDTDTDN